VNFSERVLELRKIKNLTQNDVAKITELSVMQIRRYEKGSHFPSLPTAIVLADYFDVSLDYLAGRSDEMKKT